MNQQQFSRARDVGKFLFGFGLGCLLLVSLTSCIGLVSNLTEIVGLVSCNLLMVGFAVGLDEIHRPQV